MTKRPSCIPMGECVKGHLYKIQSRNLSVGVYDGDSGFIGIRTKFYDKYLFTEYHFDTGPPHGTVCGVTDTGFSVPEDVHVYESEATTDRDTLRRVAFNKPISDGGNGWYFVDTGEPSETIVAIRRENKDLMSFLTSIVEKNPELLD